MLVSLIQMDIALGDREANWRKVRHLTANLGQRDLILLPELWSTGYRLDQAESLAEDLQGQSVRLMAEVALEHQAYVGGSILGTGSGGVYNRFVLVSSRGEVVATYAKAHLFGLMQEDLYLTAGEKLVVARVGDVSAGLAVCYDLRFPEMFRHYVDSEVSLLLLPAEWPYPRLEHWRTLLRARAIENQFYTIACNRVGSDLNNTFFGHSMVVDPWGDVVIEGEEREQVLNCELDLDLVAAARNRLPALRDRRSDLY